MANPVVVHLACEKLDITWQGSECCDEMTDLLDDLAADKLEKVVCVCLAWEYIPHPYVTELTRPHSCWRVEQNYLEIQWQQE